MTKEQTTFTGQGVLVGDAVGKFLDRALDEGEGILRLAPNWVPRSFLHPGKRLRLRPEDWYAYGAHRGGIDERWLGSATEAANEGRVWHEGLSFVTCERQRILFRDAIAQRGPDIVGPAIYEKYRRWPVLAKFFDNMGPIPHHMHQRGQDAALVGQEGKPESYYFSPQMNNVDNNFPYTFMGLHPGTTKAQVRDCLARWECGDNGILDLSPAHRLRCGTGWLVPPGVLHAPGSLCTYEPQWGSDVFSMFQSMVEGRAVPRWLLLKDIPADRHHDLDFIVEQLDWDKNVDPYFKQHNFLEPTIAGQGDGWVDRWVVYGLFDGQQLFSARELTVEPGARCRLKDLGASSWITVQGAGRIGELSLHSPQLIRFGAETEDEVFITHDAAIAGIDVSCTGPESLVSLRYFGPDVFPEMPDQAGAK